ncbi:MAG: YbaN family protein [Dehalococcoidia bacterium]|nr:MAG: YbaN family protein [Dehalococcoidia bacterium]
MEDSYRRVRSQQSGDKYSVGRYWPRVKAIILNRPLLIAVGSFSVGLAFIGIFVPILPTVPFLLLAAACYARSSERFSNWLLNNRLFGKVIRDYRDGKGVPPRTKAIAIGLLWITISLSIAFVVNLLAFKVILVLIATGVTIHILTIRRLGLLGEAHLRTERRR